MTFLTISCINTTKEGVENNRKIILPQNSQCLLLTEAGVLSEKSSLFVNTFGIPSILVDSLIFSIEQEERDSLSMFLVRFHDSTTPQNICCFDNGDIWFTEGEYLCQLQENKKDTIINIPFKNIKISHAGDGIYLSTYNEQENNYNLFFINKNTNEIHKLMSNTLQLIAIGVGNSTIVASCNMVYLLKDNIIYNLFQTQEPITHLAFAPHGFFYATDSKIGYFDSEINIIFLEKGIRDMLSYDNKLYLLLNDGALYKITNTEYFRELSNLIN